MHNSSKCYRNRSDPAPKCASFGRGRRQDVPGCLGDGRSGKLPTIAGLATVGVMVAVWPLATQPGDWTGTFSGDGGAAAPDAWFSFDAGISAGLLSGYAFAQFVTQAPDITAANTSVAWAALLAVDFPLLLGCDSPCPESMWFFYYPNHSTAYLSSRLCVSWSGPNVFVPDERDGYIAFQTPCAFLLDANYLDYESSRHYRICD